MSINDFVVDALVRDRKLKAESVWTVENHEKYSTLTGRDDGARRREAGREVFSLMRNLNELGVRSPALCADRDGNGSLREAIGALSERLATLSRGRHVHYIELGPEPVKTTELMKAVSGGEPNHLRYTAVDINESSEDAMRHAIMPFRVDINESSEDAMRHAIMPFLKTPGCFNYIADDYRNVQWNHIDLGQDVTFITMLGFQEGNELPVTIGRLIRNLGGKSTYVVSEMQLLVEGREEPIYNFYQNENMVRFSEIVSRQQGFEPLGKHHVSIVRLNLLGDQFHVAVTLQPVSKAGADGHLITNVCLKYTPEQFRHVRASHGNCRVIDELRSGDGSVVYQIAQFKG
ncbi:hypothetical protein FPJ27_16370 [Burkholderia sp. MS455]|uniref:hypothetical protein n=1 Tax=Burkholderia sp. MS455 TaxID=2811788 RepID=UPI001957F58D|nr:hypothetical protein [Burkholderia sp. MS455]QRR07811.1 hypothetical protein FPJ27_16370 [Burkholderia sp. MS455]